MFSEAIYDEKHTSALSLEASKSCLSETVCPETCLILHTKTINLL